MVVLYSVDEYDIAQTNNAHSLLNVHIPSTNFVSPCFYRHGLYCSEKRRKVPVVGWIAWSVERGGELLVAIYICL